MVSNRYYYTIILAPRTIRTVETGGIGLDVCFCDLAVLNNEGVTLGAGAAKDGGGLVKGQIEGAGELELGIGEEAHLGAVVRKVP